MNKLVKFGFVAIALVFSLASCSETTAQSTNTTQEVVAGTTRLKAGTAQKICLNLISTLLMTKLGFVKKGLMSNLVPTNKKLVKRKEYILKKLQN